MTLDVLVPTYNRADLLARTLQSLLAADPPRSIDVRVTVVDNRSTDGTPALVESFRHRFDGRLHYVFESVPGRSAALNAGIAATTGDLIGMIDDDEEVDRSWLQVIEDAFGDPAIDFIGGPYVPRWGAPRPVWLPMGYRAVIGWVDGGNVVRQYGSGFEGMLMGGNAVLRRRLLGRVGPYAADLGRTGGRLLSCEDEDMFQRLLSAGARGLYRPELVVHHYVPPERVRKSYFRRWCFWRGVSLGLLSRRQRAPVVHVLGVPRHMIGSALRGTVKALRPGGIQHAAERFASELAWWDLAGFVYGRHLYRPPETVADERTSPRVQNAAAWRTR